MREVFAFIGHGRETQRINCHHNFTQREVHNGTELWITRKGAIKADTGDLGVIPGSMGTRSYIVAGKGNEASWTSCSHGAGRRHSRTQAKKLFTTADLAEQMARQGVARQAGRRAGGRDPLGLQGHRPGHGRPGRPRGDPPHTAPGPQLQGDLNDRGGRRGSAPARDWRTAAIATRGRGVEQRRVGQRQTASLTQEDAGGSTPPSSTVAEVEVDDTPGCGPGGSRFESGRPPHRIAGDLGSARSHTPCTRVRFPLPQRIGRWVPRPGPGTGHGIHRADALARSHAATRWVSS